MGCLSSRSRQGIDEQGVHAHQLYVVRERGPITVAAACIATTRTYVFGEVQVGYSIGYSAEYGVGLTQKNKLALRRNFRKHSEILDKYYSSQL